MVRTGWHRIVIAVALAAGFIMVNASVTPTNRALGEVRGTPEPPSFQTGDQIAVPILRDILATLKQMDGRLARVESVAQKMKPATTRAPLPADDGEQN